MISKKPPKNPNSNLVLIYCQKLHNILQYYSCTMSCYVSVVGISNLGMLIYK